MTPKNAEQKQSIFLEDINKDGKEDTFTLHIDINKDGITEVLEMYIPKGFEDAAMAEIHFIIKKFPHWCHIASL